MPLESDKIAAYGPFTVTCRDKDDATISVSGHALSFSGLKFDSVTFSLTSKEQTVEFEDGSEATWEEGRVLDVEITMSEMVPAEMDGIQITKGLLFNFIQTGKNITIDGDEAASTIVSIDNFKTVIKYKKTFGADSDIASCIAIS